MKEKGTVLKGPSCLTQHDVDLFLSLCCASHLFFSVKAKVSQVTPDAILLPSVYLGGCAIHFPLPKRWLGAD